jgi:hypothetical protein
MQICVASADEKMGAVGRRLCCEGRALPVADVLTVVPPDKAPGDDVTVIDLFDHTGTRAGDSVAAIAGRVTRVAKLGDPAARPGRSTRHASFQRATARPR